MQKHLEKVHNKISLRKCYFCKEKFEIVELLKNHVRANHNCKCDICGNVLLTKSSLIVHMKKLHNKEAVE